MKFTILTCLLTLIIFATTAQKRTSEGEVFVKLYVEESSMPYRERIILCQPEVAQSRITNKLVYIKSQSLDLSLKIIKRKFNANKDWVGVSPTGEHYLISTYNSENYTHALIRPIDPASKEIIKSSEMIHFSNEDICK